MSSYIPISKVHPKDCIICKEAKAKGYPLFDHKHTNEYPKIHDNPDQVFDDWKHYIGAENLKGKPLTKEMLYEWAWDFERQVECVFCSTQYPYGTFSCRRCKKYKGIRPYIPDWSD